MAYELLDDEPTTTEGYGKQLAKGALRTGARVFETIAGIPGNILSTGLGAANIVGKAIGDKNPIPTYEDVQKKLPISFPTSSQIRESTQKLTGEELEPKSELGKHYDSAIETFTNLITPLGSLGKGAKVVPALKGALGGEIFSSIAKNIGASDTTQAIAKTAGVMSGLLGFRRGELKKTYDNNYQQFGKIADGRKIPAAPLRENIESLYDKYTQSDSPAKEFALKRLQAIEGAIQGEKIDAGKLWALKKNANEHFAEASKAERAVLKDIIDAEKEALKGIGPEYKLLESADDIYKSFLESSSALKLIQKHIPSAATLSPIIKGLFGLGSYGLGKIPLALGAASGFKITNEGRKILKFLNTTTGKEYYSKILKDSLGGNVVNLSKDITKLNNAAKEFELLEDSPGYELLD